jgi:hypothetical protein
LNPALKWLLLAIGFLQFAGVALPPGNADLISVETLALDLSRGDDSLLYPGRDFSKNDQWTAHQEANVRYLNGRGEPNWCFYPPLIPYLARPLLALDVETWRLGWGAIQLVLILLFGLLIAKLLAMNVAGTKPDRILIFALILGSYPVARSVELGQTSLIIGLLLWTGVYARAIGKGVLGVAAIGASVFVKPFLALVELVDLYRRRYGLLLGAAGVFLGLMLLSWILVGTRAHIEYWNLLTTLASSQNAYYGNQSLLAGVLRLTFRLPVMDYGFQRGPTGGHPGSLLTMLVLAAAAYSQWKSRDVNPLASTGLWISAALLALPISWEHHLVFLLPALAFLWTQSWSSRGWIALGLCTLLLELNWTSWYAESFGGRLAASLPLFGNLLLFVLLMSVHVPSRKFARAFLEVRGA